MTDRLDAIEFHEPQQRMWILRLALVFTGACGEHGEAPVDAPPDAAVPVRRGRISVSEGGAVGAERTTFAATFRELTNATITRRDEGRCLVERVTFDGVADVSAGVLTFADEDTSGTIRVAPDGENRYQAVSIDGLRYDVIELLTASAEGGAVPRFSSTFGFPDRLHITQPVLAPNETVAFSTSGFSASWDPTGGAVFFRLRQLLPNAQTFVECAFVGSEEHGSIPSAVRAALAPDATGAVTTLSVETFNGTRPMSGGFDIAIDAAFVGLSARVIVP